jgi:hypothetical protein
LLRLPGFEAFDFDFTASLEEQTSAWQQAIQQWRGNTNTRNPARTNSEILLNPSGQVQQDVLKRLLDERDNDPVYLVE